MLYASYSYSYTTKVKTRRVFAGRSALCRLPAFGVGRPRGAPTCVARRTPSPCDPIRRGAGVGVGSRTVNVLLHTLWPVQSAKPHSVQEMDGLRSAASVSRWLKAGFHAFQAGTRAGWRAVLAAALAAVGLMLSKARLQRPEFPRQKKNSHPWPLVPGILRRLHSGHTCTPRILSMSRFVVAFPP